MNQAGVNEKYKVSPFYVFFLVHSIQTGVGVLSFQRVLAKSTGTDGWISILLAGLIVHIMIWVIYKSSVSFLVISFLQIIKHLENGWGISSVYYSFFTF